MAEPTLMCCVGATKAGTSWLLRSICSHDQCSMRAAKELLYFDADAFDDWGPRVGMPSDCATRIDQYDAMAQMLGTVPAAWGQEPIEVHG